MNEETNILSVLKETASGLPDPIQKSLYKVLKELLGGLISIPNAKLKQYAQSIEDTTTARSMAASVLAKVAIEEAIKNEAVVQAAIEAYVPNSLRKKNNRRAVAQNAILHLANTQDKDIKNDTETRASLDDDWINRFTRFAEDASSQRLQDLFGRILAGEITQPGTFSLAALRTLSELDQKIANDFSHAWSKSVGEAVDYTNEWQLGDGYSIWTRLSEAGLMAPTNSIQYLPPFAKAINGSALWSPFSAHGTSSLVHFQQHSSSKWAYIGFTRVGRELGRILPKPNYNENMRQALLRLPKDGLTKIELYREGAPPELIWQS